MIPFGTFMQAAGSMPAMGKGGTGHSVTGKNGSSHAGSSHAGAEASDSFSAWVQKLTGVDATRASDGESKEQPHNEITESEATETKAMDWDQLTSLIADAMELSSELSDDGLPVDGMDLSGMEDVLQKNGEWRQS